MKPYCSVAP
ncbi:hypothetical protein VCCP1040_1612, partial [Vibrio cholerae CP1040(13)]